MLIAYKIVSHFYNLDIDGAVPNNRCNHSLDLLFRNKTHTGMLTHFLRPKIKTPTRYYWTSRTFLCSSNHNMALGCSPRTKNTFIRWTKYLERRRVLSHSQVERTTIDAEYQPRTPKDSRQLPDGHIGNQQWACLHITCNLFEHGQFFWS